MGKSLSSEPLTFRQGFNWIKLPGMRKKFGKRRENGYLSGKSGASPVFNIKLVFKNKWIIGLF